MIEIKNRKYTFSNIKLETGYFNKFLVLVTIIFLFGSSIVGQVKSSEKEERESLSKIEYLDSLDIRRFGTLRICTNDVYLCKGIITDSDINTNVDCDSIIIRAVISHSHDSIFEIKYRDGENYDFLNGTFKFYSLNGVSALAFPIDNTNFNITSEEIKNPWNFIPSSTDGREVLNAYYEKNKIIYFECKN